MLFDIPHLLKNTRNALLTCTLEIPRGKFVKFEYIKKAFELDQKKKFRLLDKLKPEYFNTGDRYYQMKVKVAAAQLIRSMAGSIEHFVASNQLPAKALFTAEFVEIIDNLFDSMNGATENGTDNKAYKCGISDTSLHLLLWDKLSNNILKWKLCRKKYY